MIYECPNCHAPQAAGQTSCPECGAEFDGPVPEDALLPEPGAGAAPAMQGAAPGGASETSPEAVLDTPPATPAQEPLLEPALAAAAPEAPVLETVQPPREELPYQRSTYQPPYTPPPAYAPTPAAGGAQAYTAKRTQSNVLPKVLLIAAPIVLALVVGGLIFSHTLDGGSDAAPAPIPMIAPALRPAAAPVGNPTVMTGGTTTAPEDSRVQWLAGRWQAKSSDFYVFNSNGSGSQGSLTGKLPTQDFLWRIVGNQLMLYGAPKDQQVRFGVGPDDNTVYLRDSAGKPVQFTREAQNSAQKP